MVLCYLCVAFFAARALAAPPPPPVILIPGIAGSQLEVRLNETYEAPAWYCRHGSAAPQWQLCWFELSSYARTACLAKEMHVGVVAEKSGGRNLTYENTPGVEVRPVDFGGVEGIRCLDPSICELSHYFAPVIDALEREAGYVVNETLFGAPYDFRMAGDGLEQEGYHAGLTDLIEAVVSRNGGVPVTLVVHSMGGMVATNFLAGKERGWTLANVGGLVFISSPFGGAPVALQSSISGAAIALPFYHDAFLQVQDNSPSGPWLFPSAGLWAGDTLVETNSRNYSATPEDYEALLRDLNRADQLLALGEVRNLKGIHLDAPSGPAFPPLNVAKVSCFFGAGRQTPKTMKYDVDGFQPGGDPPPPKYDYTDGDGVVDAKSLAYCAQAFPDAAVTSKVFQDQEHMAILGSEAMLSQLVNALLNSRPAH